MKIKGLVAVSGLPGLYKMVANRSNGLIVESLTDGKRSFASVRQHQFTPLESIGIYTDDGETTELRIVFQSILDKLDQQPLPAQNDSSEKFHEYFAQVLPNYDRDRVNTGDIKKCAKWFAYLHERGFTTAEEEESDEPTGDKDVTEVTKSFDQPLPDKSGAANRQNPAPPRRTQQRKTGRGK
jgi:Domain of unknown function (DUF5606)